MIHKLLNPFRFSTFYRQFDLGISPSHFKGQACKLATLVGAYRHYGHYYANLDPLSLYNRQKESFVKPADLQIQTGDSPQAYSFSSPVTKASQNIQQLESKLNEIYMGTTGVQFDHIINVQEKEWLYSTFETLKLREIQNDYRIKMAKILIEVEALDHFLHKKWANFKRYSGEGGQSTVVALEKLFQLSAQAGYQNVIFGMSHRGRFNVLINSLNYEARHVFRRIVDASDTPLELRNVVDDVIWIICHSVKKQYGDKKVEVSLVHNPAHLEAHSAVTMGKTRSKLDRFGKGKALNVQVHGDAAVCAQGIVAESLCIGKTPNFSIEGSIHIIKNNQIGYTTKPIDSRPSKYSTDLFKAYDIPVIHVNGQNLQDVTRSVELAVNYQAKFKKDIVLDIYCYRKYGHNEVDQPSFTQPLMYKNIREKHQPIPVKYSSQLIQEGLIKENFYEQTRNNIFKHYEKEYELSKDIKKVTLQDLRHPHSLGSPKALTEKWKSMKPSQFGTEFPTAFDISLLKDLAKASCYLPPNFAVHPRIKKFHIDKRLKGIEDNKLDWAACESLAFYTLVSEGHNLRFTGQDVERGTFSQRHINLTDQNDETTFNALEHFAKQQTGRGKVQILNSALSENAVMSYEYGYSIDNPNNLSIWEAQFGDFFTTAQVIVDLFLSCGENKWLQQSSLVLNLPHGFDGMGPDHSSCRIERFLQLANSDGSLKYLSKNNGGTERLKLKDNFFVESIQDANFSVVNPTTPASFFHVLRRQMKRDFRKPLVIAGPKALLRHPSCISKFEDLGPGSSFQPVLKYINCDRVSECSTVFLTSGKVTYDVQELIQEKGVTKTCLMAVEELFPFPQELLQEHLKGLSSSAKVYWIQEENFNGGPYQFVENRVNRVLRNLGVTKELRFVGRRAIACTAVGSVELHKQEAQQLTAWIKELIE